MPFARPLVVALAAAALGTGCAVDACEGWSLLGRSGYCTQSYRPLFTGEDEGADDSTAYCAGTLHENASCADLGYTFSCDWPSDHYVRPEDARRCP